MSRVSWSVLSVPLLLVALPAWAASQLFQIPLKTNDGSSTTLAPYHGKVLLIVNTASRCGYTPQYSALEKLQEHYQARGFEVLGFPSNDFGGQEPGSNSEIRYFCTHNYNVSFPLFDKQPVKGTAAQPLFKELVQEAATHEEIGWNFEKFLVGRDGKVLVRYKSAVTPDDPQLTQAIEGALKAGS